MAQPAGPELEEAHRSSHRSWTGRWRSPHRPEQEELGHLSFWTPFGICLVGATIAFLLRYVFEHQGWPIRADVSREVGIAFLVTAILMSVLDYRAKRITHRETIRFRDLVSRDVFQALLGRIVPPKVFNEINDILHSEVVRRECKYRIIFKKPYPGMAKDHFVIRREVRYVVENRLSRTASFLVRSAHSEDVDLAAAGWTDRDFHLALLVDDQPVELKHGENLFVEAESFSRLVHSVTLGPRESRSITLHGEEPCLVSTGRNTYLQATPVLGIEVEIWNDYKEVIGVSGVQMNHPAAGEAKPDGIGRYVLNRAFLPGQGFQVTWKEIKREAAGAG